MYLSVHLEPVADTTVVISLTGELDASTVPVLSATLQPVCASPITHVLVTCGELWFCDLSGLGRLTAARLDLMSRGGDLVLVEPNSALRRLLSLVDDGRTPPMPAYDSLPQALAACGVRQATRPRRHLPMLRGLSTASLTGRPPRKRPTPPLTAPTGLSVADPVADPIVVRSARLREETKLQMRTMELRLLTIEQTRTRLERTRAMCRRTLAEIRESRRLCGDDRFAVFPR